MVRMWHKTPPLYPLYHLIWNAVDWLYPPTCAGCDLPGSRWCKNCEESVRASQDAICPICGGMQPAGEVCHACRQSQPEYTSLRSWGVFTGPLRKAIHQFKYQNDISLGDVYAAYLIEFYTQLGWKVDFIAPIPLHPNRMRSRGYNQSALLAFPMAIKIGIPFLPKAIIRKRDTQSQVGLNRLERLDNIQDAFQSDPRLVQGKIALLIDDVTTTGATMRSCAGSLLSAGASAVFGMTLARPAFSDEKAQDS